MDNSRHHSSSRGFERTRINMYFVYILLCSDHSLYTGISNHPQQRLLEHQKGKGGAYTRSHKPQKIVYLEKCGSKSDALKREAEIKTWSKQNKLKLIRNHTL